MAPLSQSEAPLSLPLFPVCNITRPVCAVLGRRPLLTLRVVWTRAISRRPPFARSAFFRRVPAVFRGLVWPDCLALWLSSVEPSSAVLLGLGTGHTL